MVWCLNHPEKPNKIIKDESETLYISLLGKTLLYLDFNEGNSMDLPSHSYYSMNQVGSSNVWQEANSRLYGPGNILFHISPNFYRGAVCPDNVIQNTTGLEGYLASSRDIESDSPIVLDVADEIRKTVMPKFRDNPYCLTEAIIDWIRTNIEYTLLPKRLVRATAYVVGELSSDERLDVYKILRNSMPSSYSNAFLEDVANHIELPERLKHADDYHVAKEILDQAGSLSSMFHQSWVVNGECNSTNTLKEKAGKCVGISYLFIALSRALGVPSRDVGGLFFDLPKNRSENHAWAASYIAPYGWVEADPTMHRFQYFDPSCYGYLLSYSEPGKPKFQILDKGARLSDLQITNLIKSLKKDDSLKGKLKKSLQFRKEISLLKSIKKNNI